MFNLDPAIFEPLLLKITDLLLTQKKTISSAESCTGGLLASLLTDRSGSSSIYVGGICSYANSAKQNILKISGEVLSQEGAVSEKTATLMAKHAAQLFATNYAVSVTGIAGPTGGTPSKPVGTVWIGCHGPQGTVAHRHYLDGLSRKAFRAKVSELALTSILSYIDENS